jgi:hypothetical protein
LRGSELLVVVRCVPFSSSFSRPSTTTTTTTKEEEKEKEKEKEERLLLRYKVYYCALLLHS